MSLGLLHTHRGLIPHENEEHSMVDEADRIEALQRIQELEKEHNQYKGMFSQQLKEYMILFHIVLREGYSKETSGWVKRTMGNVPVVESDDGEVM